MRSRTTERFRKAFGQLPEEVKRRAREAYKLFSENPQHPSLRFKQVHATMAIWSVRVGVHYRALGVRQPDVIIWFWIGSHGDYEKLISQL